jgi:hypothetical protein
MPEQKNGFNRDKRDPGDKRSLCGGMGVSEYRGKSPDTWTTLEIQMLNYILPLYPALDFLIPLIPVGL